MNNILLTGDEVAKALKISRSKAFSLLRQGEITTVRFGRNVRVRTEDLEKFISTHVSEPDQTISLTNIVGQKKAHRLIGCKKDEVRHD